ncbi:MAG: DUF4465 domain-containing protein [Saprospiraceae bacterium]
MRRLFTFLLVAITSIASAQTLVDFESFNLPVDSFLNGSDGSGGFMVGNIELPNDYNVSFNSWKGWSITAGTDVTTAGYTNQFNSIVGSGYSNSTTYAISYVSDAGSQIKLTGNAKGGMVKGFYISNATYTYLSMKDGDGFAKKFGGATGDDPDFLLLTIKKYKDGILSTDSVDFYLADYRFSDNTQDYIINDWQYVDLTSLGDVDSLAFSMSSTDNSTWGMNTPAYFCIDNFETADHTVNTTAINTPTFRVFPNPASDFITIEGLDNTIENGQIWITDAAGRVVYSEQNVNISDRKILDVNHLIRGVYFVKIGNSTVKLIKQ